MEDVKKWLDKKAKDYSEGMLLLAKHSKNRLLINRISRKQWPEKLEYELRKIYERWIELKASNSKSKADNKKQAEEAKKKLVAEDEFSIADPGKRKIIVRQQEIKFDDLPGELQEKWKENSALYKESRSLHEKLKLLQTADETIRKPLAERLILISKTVRENWALIDAYDPEHTKQEGESKTQDVDHKRINSNRTFISRNRNNPGKKEAVQQRITELLASGEVFSEDITKELKELGFELGGQ